MARVTTVSIRRVGIIANPVSGLGRSARVLPALERELSRSGIEAEVCLTERSGHAGELAARFLGRADAVVAVGGDGTINEVLNGIARHDLPFAVFPTGTANVLAKEFRLPHTVRDFVRMVRHGRIRIIDTGVVNGKRFVLFAGIGLDARVTRILSHVRKSTISMLDYVLPTMKVVLEFRSPELSLTVDGKRFAEGGSYCLISNVRKYGGPFEISWQADPTDGLLDVVVTLGRRRIDMLRYFWASFVRRLRDHGDVLHARGKEVVVEARHEAPYQLDGDFAGTLPAVFIMQPRSLALVTPSDT